VLNKTYFFLEFLSDGLFETMTYCFIFNAILYPIEYLVNYDYEIIYRSRLKLAKLEEKKSTLT